MRTTLDIAEDVLCAAKERAHSEGKTTGQVISELARVALTGRIAPAPSRVRPEREPKAVYGFRPFAARGSTVTNRIIDKLRAGGAY
jgi:hypothetical protein